MNSVLVGNVEVAKVLPSSTGRSPNMLTLHILMSEWPSQSSEANPTGNSDLSSFGKKDGQTFCRHTILLEAHNFNFQP